MSELNAANLPLTPAQELARLLAADLDVVRLAAEASQGLTNRSPMLHALSQLNAPQAQNALFIRALRSPFSY